MGGGDASAATLDVRDADGVRDVVAATVDRHGRLDVACNNAGINGPPAPLADLAVADFDDVVAVNLRGVFLAMKHEIPAMAAAGGGAIVNMSSVGGLTGNTNFSAYIASSTASSG